MTLAVAAGLAWLAFTVPSTNAYVEGDSVFQCTGGPTMTDVAWIRMIRQDVTGGPAYAFDSLYVAGKEGQPDSIQVDPGPGAHFYAQTVDLSGNPSCFSEGVYLPGYITGVDPGDGPEWRSPVSIRLYDIQGRPAQGKLASGVYRKVEVYADGHRRYTKIVVLR